MEPAGNRFEFVNGSHSAGEDEERGLESVLGILFLVQQAPADAQNQAAVPLDNGRKRHFIAESEKPTEKLRVGQIRKRPTVAERAQNRVELRFGHEAHDTPKNDTAAAASPRIVSGGREISPCFLGGAASRRSSPA